MKLLYVYLTEGCFISYNYRPVPNHVDYIKLIGKM